MIKRTWLVWLCTSLGLCALWVPLRGRVIYRRLDLHDVYVPELELHLHGNHSTAPALWDPDVQLGRPAIQGSGVSPAYELTRLLSWVLDDPWVVYSTLVLATLVLGGFFAWALFRTLGLAPAAAATAALGFAFSSFHGNGAPILTYVSSSTWTMGLAWALARFLRGPALANGLWLAFVVHALILSGYPQAVVWSAWLTPVLVCAFWPRGARNGLPRLVALLAFLLLGVLCASPFLLDLLTKARDSARFVVDESLLPPLDPHGWRGWLAALGNLGDPFLSPADERTAMQAFSFSSFSWTPFFGAALLLAVCTVRSRLVLCSFGFVAATVLASLSPPVFYFGVRHLGLFLSLYTPWAAALVPSFLLAAVGLDHCLRSRLRWSPVLCALGVGLPPLAAGLVTGRQLDGFDVAAALVLTGAAASLAAPRWPLLGGAALLSAWHYGVLALPSASRAEVRQRLALQEPLTAELHRRTDAGGRFAWFGAGPELFLWPNTEQLYGLRSIHSYDSLSPRRYQDWAARISREGAQYHGRFFKRIVGTEALAGEDFARAGVRLVLALEEQDSPALRACGKVGRVRLYEPVEQRPLEAWIPSSACVLSEGAASVPGALRSAARVERRPGPDESVVFTLEPRDEPGLLWLSQQYHPDWHAEAGARVLVTVPVDGIWQGVLVPAGTSELALEFRPWIRWYWVPQLFFALAGLFLLARWRPFLPSTSPSAVSPG